MTTVLCWVVIHTSLTKSDNRSYVQMHGVIMRATSDSLVINFSNAFALKKVNIEINSVEQLINENECLYETN